MKITSETTAFGVVTSITTSRLSTFLTPQQNYAYLIQHILSPTNTFPAAIKMVLLDENPVRSPPPPTPPKSTRYIADPPTDSLISHCIENFNISGDMECLAKCKSDLQGRRQARQDPRRLPKYPTSACPQNGHCKAVNGGVCCRCFEEGAWRQDDQARPREVLAREEYQ